MSADYKRKGNQVDESEMERSLSLEDYPVILYCHGNSYDRAFEYRVSMYNLLNRLDYHVVSFDYRGYGDSPGTPNEAGVVSDSRVVYDYVKSHSYRNTLIVWGHSLGSAYV
ncbi:unnamed protein product [Heligmosomoides polygyrus]|uniref:Lysophosphatidylserine lipase ABHD12 n=1 Tax=Heligmosomoides polygyrus TaxID=6339 RepID=A0A183FGJ6_HELPZ|nr:unnamed protein product [Heligmosomoides polygyrus]